MWSFNLNIWVLLLPCFANIGYSTPLSYHTSREVHSSSSHANTQVLRKRWYSSLPIGYPKIEMKASITGYLGADTYYGTIEEELFIKATGTNGVAIKIDPMEWEDLDRYASEGYEQVITGFTNTEEFKDIVVVTAQYTPGVGLSVWSKPRGKAAVDDLWKLGIEAYPHYMKFINEREMIDENGDHREIPGKGIPREKMLHAEDAAAIGSAIQAVKKENENIQKKKDKISHMRKFKFIANTRAVTYGKFFGKDTLSVKPPCGSPNTVPPFTRSCAVTSNEHGIAYTSYKGPLGGRPARLGGTGTYAKASATEQESKALQQGGSKSKSSNSVTSSWEQAAIAAADKMDTTEG